MAEVVEDSGGQCAGHPMNSYCLAPVGTISALHFCSRCEVVPAHTEVFYMALEIESRAFMLNYTPSLFLIYALENFGTVSC